EKLVEELAPERDPSRHPLFQVNFAVQNAPLEELELPGLTVSHFQEEVTSTRFDMEWHVWEHADGLQLVVFYNTDLFEAATIARMLGHYQRVLEAMVAAPGQRVSALALLSEAERHQLLVQWNDTERAYPQAQCVHEWFEAQVARTPEAVAVRFREFALTYAE